MALIWSHILISTLLGLGNGAQADLLEPVEQCRINLLERKPYADADLDGGGTTAERNLEFLPDPVKATHGGRYFILRRVRKEWNSTWESAPGAPLGDVRNFARLVGPELAAYFSFYKLGEAYLTLPDTAEVIAAIEKLNVALFMKGLAPVRLRFNAPISVNGGKPHEETVDGFVTNFELPLQRSGALAVYHRSFRLRAILYENVYSELRRLEKRLREFRIYLRGNVTLHPQLDYMDQFIFAKRLVEASYRRLMAMDRKMVEGLAPAADVDAAVTTALNEVFEEWKQKGEFYSDDKRRWLMEVFAQFKERHPLTDLSAFGVRHEDAESFSRRRARDFNLALAPGP